MLLSLLFSAQAFDINLAQYNKDNIWFQPPEFIICKDAPVTKLQVYKAAQEWKRSGVESGDIHLEQNDECTDKYEKGYILIMGNRDDLNSDKNHAVTIRWYQRKYKADERKTVHSAFTEIDPQSILLYPSQVHKLLTHELGHAFGYSHTNIQNDIMIATIMNR